MTGTLDDVTKKGKPELSAEQLAARELVRRARDQGLSLTEPDGLQKQTTKTVLKTALELTEHLGREKHGQAAEPGSIRNGTRSKTVLPESTGRVMVRDSTTDVLAGLLARVPVIGFANKPGKARLLAYAHAASVTTELTKITRALSR